MGRTYVVSQSEIAVTGAQTLLEMTALSDGVVRIIAVYVGQSSDEGDTGEAEIIPVVLQRTDVVAVDGLGTALTPRPVHVGAGAAVTTVDGNVSGQGSPQDPLYSDVWNVQSGWHYEPTPLGMIWIPPSGIFGVRLTGAPNDELTMSYSMVFEEFD